MIYLYFMLYYSRIILTLYSITHCTRDKITHDDANTYSTKLLNGKCQGWQFLKNNLNTHYIILYYVWQNILHINSTESSHRLEQVSRKDDFKLVRVSQCGVKYFASKNVQYYYIL